MENRISPPLLKFLEFQRLVNLIYGEAVSAHNSHKSKTNDTPRPPRVRPRGQEGGKRKQEVVARKKEKSLEKEVVHFDGRAVSWSILYLYYVAQFSSECRMHRNQALV